MTSFGAVNDVSFAFLLGSMDDGERGAVSDGGN